MVKALAETCVVCGAPAALMRPVVTIDAAVLRPCNACGSWTYLPHPAAHELAAYHDNDEYFAHPYFQLRREATQATESRCRRVFGKILVHAPDVTLNGALVLDVGCDTGLFVATAARLYGVRPFGVDVASRAIAEAARLGVHVHRSTLETAPAAFTAFDVITAVDLIEHVADPRALFRAMHDRLRPGGVAFVETPNTGSTIYRVGTALAAATTGFPKGVMRRLFPPEHVQYFSRRGIELAAGHAGFTVAAAGTRNLPMADIAVGVPLRLVLGAMQWPDAVLGQGALRWALLRKPVA